MQVEGQCNILDFSKPLRVALFGFDEHDRKSLQQHLRNTAKHYAIVVDAKDAQAGIFDFDNSETSLCWASYRRLCPDLPTIVIGSYDPQISDTFFIGKPVRMSELKQAIHSIKQKQPNDQKARPGVVPISAHATLHSVT